MKGFLRAFFVPVIFGFFSVAPAQEYTLTLEEHATDIVPGLTTYRMYIDMVNTDDFLSSIYGGDTAPLLISTSDNSFFNSGFGGATASNINPAFLAFFPELAADSWVTIGIDQQETGDEVAISTLEDPAQPFVECFASGSTLDGQNVVIDSSVGGAWYVLNGAPNGLPDENMRVLFLQMTTAGEICGTINVQVFENGVGSASLYFTYDFCGTGTFSPSTASGGCTDEMACNYDAEATEDDGSCVYAETYYDCEGNCVSDVDGDGICDELEVAGCTDSFACNYNMDATDDDGTCDYLSCSGCTDDTACNYDPNAIYEDGTCDYSCNEGCTNPSACNYDPDALQEDGSCDYTSCVGCTDEGACNYDPIFTVDNGSCDYSCLGCTDEAACNYDANATGDDGSCTYAETYYDCDGNCLMDMDGDGVCDELEVAGCMDEAACNYDMNATDEDGSCEFPAAFYDCDGNCLMDMDGDGVCDELEVEGCTDEAACNYDVDATNNDGSCDFPAAGYDCDGNCLADTDGDGICDPFEVAGCTDAMACNYDATATDDDGMCEYAEEFYNCDGTCLNDTDGDGVCDELEIAGCTDEMACNYDATATDDDGMCEYADEYYDCEGNCLNDADGDGVCDELEIAGCTDEMACNYDAAATDDDGMCEYAEEYYDCEGNCLNDADGDGVCDELEVAGCTDPEAENYNEDATDDDGSCYYCDIELSADATNETEGDGSGTINVDVTGGTAPYEFAWTGPDAFESTDEDLTGLSAGTYVLTVTDANGCTATVEGTVDNVTGIAELQAVDFDVYPNPTNGAFWINGTGLNGKTVVELLDASGRLINRFERTLNGQPVQFELGGVETGFYHVVLRNGQQQGAKRLLIH